VAKLDTAPASKAGDSRFESWLPRSRRAGLDHPVDIVAYILFFLGGLTFGYAAPGRLRWVALVLPLGLALITVLSEGIDGLFILRLVLALLLTVAGVLLGVLLDRRQAGYA
jgi:hypothetical protein